MSVSEANQIVPLDRGLLEVRKMLAQNQKGIEALVGRFMDPARFCGTILTLCRHNPTLADANKVSRASLLLSVMRIAQWQLSPDPALGQAYIVPRKGHAEAQLGYKGALALAYRSPLVAAVRYNVVGKNDQYLWKDGREWILEHEPSPDGWPEKIEDIVAAWCIIELKSGKALPRWMYLPEILHHKSRGQGSQPAWATDPSPMCVKTVIGDACRRGPIEGDVARAFQLDHLGEMGKGQPEDDSLTPEYTVENGEEQRGNLARFKSAHRQRNPSEPDGESSGREPPDGPAVDLSGSEDVSPPAADSPAPDGLESQVGGGDIPFQGGDATFASTQSLQGLSPAGSDAAPGVAQEPPGPQLLSLARVAELKKFCAQSGKSVDEMESRFGPLDELSTDQDGSVVAWIKAPAAKGKRS